ncbi:MAG: hypothetical protein HOQ02_02130 [Lysobacter sp.]|nr:hypothetical protein [Lysobacter sp.]
MRALALAAGVLWAAPNTLLGLVAGLVALPFGARLHWRSGELALVFQHYPWGPGGALTLGNVILHTGDRLDVACRTYAHHAGLVEEAPISLAAHERAHVLQAMALGPMFLPLYLLCGGVSARNRFERAADRYARSGRGWWPWGDAPPASPPTNGRPP